MYNQFSPLSQVLFYRLAANDIEIISRPVNVVYFISRRRFSSSDTKRLFCYLSFYYQLNYVDVYRRIKIEFCDVQYLLFSNVGILSTDWSKNHAIIFFSILKKNYQAFFFYISFFLDNNIYKSFQTFKKLNSGLFFIQNKDYVTVSIFRNLIYIPMKITLSPDYGYSCSYNE